MEDHCCSSVVEILPYSACVVTCMGVHFPAVELDYTIHFTTLSRMSGFLWHSSNWPAGLIVSFNICQRAKCKHVDSAPTLTMWLLCSNSIPQISFKPI